MFQSTLVHYIHSTLVKKLSEIARLTSQYTIQTIVGTMVKNAFTCYQIQVGVNKLLSMT